jgi:uncharacterized membrane protein
VVVDSLVAAEVDSAVEVVVVVAFVAVVVSTASLFSLIYPASGSIVLLPSSSPAVASLRS